MRRVVFSVITIAALLVIVFIGSSNRQVPVRTAIPAEISYQNKTYGVDPENIKNINKEVGITDDSRFKVSSIKNVDIKDSIAILVTPDIYTPIYYKAVRK